MSSQRLFRLFAFAAAAAATWAAYMWWRTGDAGPQWLQQAALACSLAALVTALVGQETRPRLMLRFLAALFALIAVIAFAADWTASEAAYGRSVGAKTLLEHLVAFAPRLVAALRASATSAFGPSGWDPVLTSVLGLPASLTFAGLAAITGYAGRPRRTVQIFVN